MAACLTPGSLTGSDCTAWRLELNWCSACRARIVDPKAPPEPGVPRVEEILSGPPEGLPPHLRSRVEREWPKPGASVTLKPPLGIKPEWLWREQRCRELIRALASYDGLQIGELQHAWGAELGGHMRFLSERAESGSRPDVGPVPG